ncbi:hypothetical protein [Flavobacterium sp.]|uniref:hypothetical protein n=1 Tax=Flavobacterium sp. TaxID=239 RepID=UPI00375195C2
MVTESQKSHFLNLYHIALCDMQIEPIELEKLYLIGVEKGISNEEIDTIVLHPDKIKFHVPESVDQKIEYLFELAQIAWSDGKIDQNEKLTLELFCSKFGFAQEHVSTITQFILDEVEKNTKLSEVLSIVNQNL